MAVNKRINNIPVSNEAIRRRIMTTIHGVERETGLFMERYMSKQPDTDTWMDFVSDVCSLSEKKPKDVDTFSDYEIILAKVKDDPDFSQSTEYVQMKKAIERSKVFDYIAFSLKNELFEVCTEHLEKYCLSFIYEAREMELNSVQEYENKIIEWKREIRDKLDVIQSVVEEEKRYETPLSDYVQHYDRILHLMGETCRLLQRACEPMKRWVVSDANYARRIQEETNQYNKKKMQIKEAILEMQDHQAALGQKVKRKEFNAGKIGLLLSEARDERRWYRRRELKVKKNYQKSERDFMNRKDQLKNLVGKIKIRQAINPTVFDSLSTNAANLRNEILATDRKLDTTRFQITNLKKSQNNVERNLVTLEAEFDKCMRQHDMAVKDYKDMIGKIQLLRDQLKLLDDKTAALKNLREMKLHSDTIKKIFHYGYNPGQMSQVRDELEEAFRLAAPIIGRDWPWLYQQLPFIPPRDFQQRSHDIEIIDLGNRRVDKGLNHVAFKSLEKWRRLSSAADVSALLNTMKRIKKKDAAKKIQQQLSVPPILVS